MRFTEEEMNIMKVLKENIGVEYLARDKEFGLHGYIGKPHKIGNIWDNDHGWRIGIRGIDSIKWEDDEPICLDDVFNEPENDGIISNLGGDGDFKKMVDNLSKIFKYDKDKSGFLKHMTISANYDNRFKISEIILNGGYGCYMFITPDGISWNDGTGNRTKLIVSREELKEFW